MSSSESDWGPPEDPDLNAILKDADDNARAGQLSLAHQKFQWICRSAAKQPPFDSGFWRSFGLPHWFKLAEIYAPAKVAIMALRDEAEANLAESTVENVRELFNDVAALNRILGDKQRIVDCFTSLERRDPAIAKAVFWTARKSLLEVKAYSLCSKYLDIDLTFSMYFRLLREAFASQTLPRLTFAVSHRVRQELWTCIALLVLNDRKDEALDAAKRARQEWDDAEFHECLETALTGKLPYEL